MFSRILATALVAGLSLPALCQEMQMFWYFDRMRLYGHNQALK
jgi:hypothetical protein